MYNNLQKYKIIAFTFLMFILFSFSHQFVYAEEMTMSKGQNHSINSNLSGCKSSNPMCVSASESYTNQSGLYHCTFVAIGDNCNSTVTIGGGTSSRVINVTVGDPSQAEPSTPSEEKDITLEVGGSSSDISNTDVCVSDNPSCVSTSSSVASPSIGTYSCKFQAIAPNCSANVTIGMGNGKKIYHVKTTEKKGSTSGSGTTSSEANNSSNNNGTLTCDYVLGDYDDPEYLGYYLVKLLEVIKFAGPILVVVMTIVDLIKVLANGKNDELTKLGVKTLKRLIYAIMLFIIPTLLNWAFMQIGIYGVCGIGVEG